MIRLFVGLPLPEDVRRYLLSLHMGVRFARWQRDDQLHLTLKFVGEVPESTARDLDENLAQIRMAPFTLSLEGAGIFGDMRRPRVLWAGVTPQGEVTRLRDKVEMAALRAGIPLEQRKYVPHVTLARFSGERQAESGLAAFLEARGDLRTPPFLVREFALFSSHLSSSGSIYRVEARYPLDGEDWSD